MHETLLLVAVAAAIAIRPATTDACGNAVHLIDGDVQHIVEIENSIEQGRYLEAKRKLFFVRFRDAALRQRATDALAVIQLRVPERAKDREDAVRYFTTRAREATDVRFRAWLAEAYVATGRLDDARVILTDLLQRDLMPDAVAYLALAKVTTGLERFQALKTCLSRARNKRMCELPSTVIGQPASS